MNLMTAEKLDPMEQRKQIIASRNRMLGLVLAGLAVPEQLARAELHRLERAGPVDLLRGELLRGDRGRERLGSAHPGRERLINPWAPG